MVILFIYISNVIPFPGFTSTNPHPIPMHPASMRVITSATHTLLSHALAFSYAGASSLHRTKGLPPTDDNKAILCYICS